MDRLQLRTRLDARRRIGRRQRDRIHTARIASRPSAPCARPKAGTSARENRTEAPPCCACLLRSRRSLARPPASARERPSETPASRFPPCRRQNLYSPGANLARRKGQLGRAESRRPALLRRPLRRRPERPSGAGAASLASSRPARMFSIRNAFPVTSERLSEVRRICPPPSPDDPSIRIMILPPSWPDPRKAGS